MQHRPGNPHPAPSRAPQVNCPRTDLLLISVSLRLSVSPSLRLSVSPPLRLSVSPPLSLSAPPSLRLSVSPSHQVEIFYSREPVVDYIEACVRTVLDIHTLQPKGDILVFLPGQVEIDRVVEMVNDRVSGLARALQDVLCLPMYVMLLTYGVTVTS